MEYRCIKCGRTLPITTEKSHCDCGGLWELEYHPPGYHPSLIENEQGMFRYRKFLPLSDETWRSVTMGEGMTPIVSIDGNILLKLDFCMPTGSFKDRGAAVLIAHCLSLGIKKVIIDSSGNAGCAIAAYCARAGITCEVFVPEGTSQKKIDMILAYGADCTIVEGSRDRCARVCRKKAEETGIFYASHVYSPFFFQGTKTYIYEILEQLGRMPECLIIPVGNGTLFLGAAIALREFKASGVIDHTPKLLLVQSENCDPIFRRSHGLWEAKTWTKTEAEGIAIGEPARMEEILKAAEEWHAEFIHAPEEEILKAQKALAHKGIYAEPTSAASYAAYLAYKKAHDMTSECLIPMCGSGLKSH